MKKEYVYCLMSILAVILGLVFALCGYILQSNPLPRKSALLMLSIVLIITGICAFAVNYKKYKIIANLFQHRSPVIAHWTYSPGSSQLIKELIEEQKNSSMATAVLFLVLSLIFCFVFANSGSTNVLYTGCILAFICVGTFLVSLRFLSTYYRNLAQSEVHVIFGEDCFYFLDELFQLQRGYHFLENITLSQGAEDHIAFEYGLYDVDEPPEYVVKVPIPSGKLHTANHLKDYYKDLIKYVHDL